MRVRRYEAGQVLEYDVRGVWPERRARVRLEVERHVGGGYAGQVYRVRIADIDAPEGPIEGLEPGRSYALKVLVPVSGFGRFIRNLLYGIGFQGPFAPQVNPDAARAGALWQKFIRRAAAGRFGTERSVVDVLATLVDPVLGSCGEISEWVDGRLWRYEVDDNLFERLDWKPGRPDEGPGLAGIPGQADVHEGPRGHDARNGRSRARPPVRVVDDEEPAERAEAAGGGRRPGARARRRRFPGRHGPPALPAAVPRGLQAHRPKASARGSLVQFDRGDIGALEAYVAGHAEAFAGMAGALEALKSADQAYRDSLPDITHHHIKLITRPRLWTAIHRAWVRGWEIRRMADPAAAGRLGKNRFAAILFLLLGLLPLLTPVLFLLEFPGRSVGRWLLWLVPLLGPFVRKLWGRAEIRRHVGALLTKAGYLGRAFKGHVAEALVGWHRSGRVSEERALAIAAKPGLYLLNRPLAFLPAGVHRFLTDKAYFKERLHIMFVKPFQLYFKPAVREKWLKDMVEEGRKNRMLSAEDARGILAQIDEPYIQKYLKSLAVHMATLFISETVFLTIAVIYVLGHPEFGWAEATARAALIIGAFNLLPVSPGSLVRGFYVLGLCVKERNIKDYRLALPVSFFKIIGYLAFPLQMAYRFPELARFMAGHWATEAVHVVPVFGERGAWLEHAVFDAFYNYPLSLGIRIRERDRIAAATEAPLVGGPAGRASSGRLLSRSSIISSSARPAACRSSRTSGGRYSWRRSARVISRLYGPGGRRWASASPRESWSALWSGSPTASSTPSSRLRSLGSARRPERLRRTAPRPWAFFGKPLSSPSWPSPAPSWPRPAGPSL